MTSKPPPNEPYDQCRECSFDRHAEAQRVAEPMNNPQRPSSDEAEQRQENELSLVEQKLNDQVAADKTSADTESLDSVGFKITPADNQRADHPENTDHRDALRGGVLDPVVDRRLHLQKTVNPRARVVAARQQPDLEVAVVDQIETRDQEHQTRETAHVGQAPAASLWPRRFWRAPSSLSKR